MAMTYSGIIFDFNGTLFWDTPLHNKSWDLFLEKYQISLSDEDKFLKIHGKNNREIFPSILNRSLTEEEIRRFTLEKEGLYQQLCLQQSLSLAPGVIDFLDHLLAIQLPFTIATASGRENVDFYFEHLNLAKWFDFDRVVYDNGKMKGKPNPDLYLKAMEILGKQPQEVTVFEDAKAGIQSARNAKVGHIIIVNSNNDNYKDWPDFQIIRDFDEVDRTLFLP